MEGVFMTEKKGRKKIRYAVVGLGYISQIAVLPSFQNASKNSELVALVSDDPEKMNELSKDYNVDLMYSYEEYEDCLQSGNIDAVYIALPNHMHEDYTIRAAKAGIHVLCEKPMAVTEEECMNMIRAAEQNDIKLMISYRLHFEQANLKSVEIATSGEIGDPRIFTSVFTQQVQEGNIRLNEIALGGGPTYDLGIYCINAARYLFREEPREVTAFRVSGDDPRFRDSEETLSGVLKFPGARVATFTCGNGAADVSSFQLVGTKGDIRLDPAYEHAAELIQYVTVEGNTRKKKFKKRDQFSPVLLYFSDCILKNKDPEPSGWEGLADVRIIRALHKSAESGESVRLERFERNERPTIEQEIERPAFSKPELVHADQPSEEK
jgi:glucose-fructose oxidoreductase